MKVIESGQFNPKRILCPRCKAVLEYNREDVQEAWFGANYGGESRQKEQYITCPECGADHVLGFDEKFL